MRVRLALAPGRSHLYPCETTVLESKALPIDCPRGAALEQAGTGLEKIVLDSLRRLPQGEAPLLAWPLVCGSVVGERTQALEFSNSVLRVEVPDAGWKREMQSLAPRYLATLNRYAGQKVAAIEFVIRQAKQE